MKSGTRIGLNWSVFSNTASGAARRAFELHRRLTGAFDFVAFVNSKFPDEMKRQFPSFDFVEIAESRSFGSRTREFFSGFWRKQLLENECGLWITDTLPVPSGLGGVRTCITIHDLRYLASRRYVSMKRYVLMLMFMRGSLRRADSIIAVSRWTADRLKKEFPFSGGKTTVIPNAVSRGFPNPSETKGSLPDKAYILSVGHLERRKNFEVLVEAFAEIAGRWSGFLVLVGKDQGARDSVVLRAEELGISDRVVIREDVDFETLNELYRECELLVCPAKYEGFGMTVLEGMAAGKPVVASDIPPHREVGGTACIYADPDNPAVFASAVMKILSDNAFSVRLVEEGFERTKAFSWDRSAQQLGSLYNSLLER